MHKNSRVSSRQSWARLLSGLWETLEATVERGQNKGSAPEVHIAL